MKRNGFKFIILVGLIGLSVFQIGKLWFGTETNHSFFSNALSEIEGTTNRQTTEVFFEPEYMALYKADVKGEYAIVDYSQLQYTTMREDTLGLLSGLLNGRMMMPEEIEKLTVLERVHFYYRLPFALSLNQLAADLMVIRSKKDITFTEMIILPASLEEKEVEVYFLNQDSKLLVGYVIDKNEVKKVNQALYDYLTNESVGQEGRLMSTRQLALSRLRGEILVPNKDRVFTIPKRLTIKRHFINDKGLDERAFTEFVGNFSKNPRLLWNTSTSDQLRQGDNDLVMTYQADGLFTYRRIHLGESQSTLTAAKAYRRVKEFLKKDSLLTNQEYRLSDYYHNGDSHHFYFNYYYRGIPLYNSEAYVMEVVVTGDQVTQYRRLLLVTDELLQPAPRFRVDYNLALNRFYAKNNQRVNDLYLSYSVEDDKLSLAWVIKGKDYDWVYRLKEGSDSGELE